MDNSCEIRIYDEHFNWINATEQAESVIFTRELYSVGKFEIHMHPNKKAVNDLIKRNNIIVINRDGHKSGVVRDFTIGEDRQKSTFIIYGDTGAGFAKQRITVPPTQAQDVTALGWDKIKANAEMVIKHYVAKNMVAPYDATRKIPHLIMQPNLNRGAIIPWKSRFFKLDDELYNICSYSEIGYEIYADTAKKQWVFDVIVGTDRTKSQTTVSPVTFNMAYQNVENYTYTEDYQNYKNTGYAGGTGEDEKRLMYTIGAQNSGINRHETFLDCGNTALLDELIYYGNQKLNEFKEAKTVEASALPRVFTFEKDYFLGDIVTVTIARLGLTIDTRITSVREVWERATGYKTEIRFGGKLPNLFTILNQTKEVR